MPDPRWSANEISSRFSRINQENNQLMADINYLRNTVSSLVEVVAVVEARVAELEEVLDERDL